MKHLFILRHAQALAETPGGSDSARPLSQGGREDAQRLGQILAARALQPDLVLSSPAKRTVETLDLVAAALPKPPPIQVIASLYLAPLGVLLAQLRSSKAAASSILLVGHNPGLENLVSEVTRHPEQPNERALLRDLRQGLPTCAFVRLDFDMADWRSLTPGEGRLAEFLSPKSSHP